MVWVFSEGIKLDRTSLLAKQFQRAPLAKFITQQPTLHLTSANRLRAV